MFRLSRRNRVDGEEKEKDGVAEWRMAKKEIEK